MRKILQRMWKYMIETIAAVNQAVNSFIWGIPAMVCIIGVGLLLSVRTGFLQIRKFPSAIPTDGIHGIILNPWNRTLMLDKTLLQIILGSN